MSTQHSHTDDHLSRTRYTGSLSALLDAQRVQGDLLAVIAAPDALFLDADRLEFLARRAHKLIAACIDIEKDRP